MFKTLSSLISTMFFFAVIGVIVAITVFWKITQDLPDFHQLEKYEPPVTTRLYAGDGQLLMEYAAQKRLFVPESMIPEKVKQAFIAAEDKSFYSHAGIDFFGIARAVISNLKNLGSGRRPSGASTITQQVAKNFLLSSELSITRKLKEAVLATRMEQTFSKQHILELYLNEIYLGNRSYGVAAAALNYFGKSLNDLELEEVAYLAALPKGPNNYNPKTKYDAAVARRNWVLGRMHEDGYITEDEMIIAQGKPLKTVDRGAEFVQDADYFSEEVRREVKEMFGEDALYEGGLIVRTTLDPKLQKIATESFRKEIENYDIRHGYRGPIAELDINSDYAEDFKKIQKPKGAKENWQIALVTEVYADRAEIKIRDGGRGEVPLALIGWARKNLKNQGISDAPKSVKTVLKQGDVILVEKATDKVIKNKKVSEDSYELRQVPDVEGGLIALDPHTGKVLAIVGGYDFDKSQFNRATQARRQTGSSFKPIVYLAALENGYSPTDLILDAPFVLDQGAGLPKWKPVNYSKKFDGLTTMRQGLEKSRNLMTVRLAQDLGMKEVCEYAKKLGVNDHLPELLSMSLGAGDTRLIDLSTAYAMMVNGGKKIKPYFIEQIQDRNGKTIYKHDTRVCTDCKAQKWENQDVPQLTDAREQVIDPLSAYQMVSMLEGVATRGTAARLRWLKKHLAGKTGTSNDSNDAWFMGFSPDLVVGTYVGFDEPRTLGRRETGSTAALPIFYDFMEQALKGKPDVPFRIPNGIRLVRINYKTGKPAVPQDKSVITEALKPDFDFNNRQRVIGDDNAEGGNQSSNAVYNEQSNDDFQLGTQY